MTKTPKLLKTIEQRGVAAHVYDKNLLGEFIVRFFVEGTHQEDADYFTDDKADAIGTAQAGVDHLATKQRNVE